MGAELGAAHGACGVQGEAAGHHGQTGHQGDQGVAHHDDQGVLLHVLLLVQIGTVDERTVARHRKREKRLSKGKNPDLRVRKPLRVQCENIAVLMSGDASFYSGTKKLVLELEKEKIKYNILPGISSVSYMSAKTGVPLDEAGFLSLHGRKMSIMGTILLSRYTYILTQSDCGIICQRLQKIGFGGFKVYIGENLSLENEKITCDYAKNLTEYESCGLCVMLVENNEKLIDGIAGIPDENFIRGNVPMTKREIRASIASRMHVSKNECIYDIGAGTGSVSIELALADYMGTVYAIEENEEACALIKENSDKFGTDNIQIVNGRAQEKINELPAPDSVFIGGSKGMLKDIIDQLIRKNPSVHIVMTAVTMETLNEALEYLEINFQKVETVCIAVTNVVKRGRYHMPDVQNPIFIIDAR